MKNGIIATLMTAILASSCSVNVKVKKDAKNSQLQGVTNSASLAPSKDFLKQLDGLRTTAADIILKELASDDYVAAFRKAVRSYRKFIIEKSAEPVVITDKFYADTSKECRDSGLSLNLDDNNEMLGMILKTVALAKLSEIDVGKINAGLAKELQAVTQFITMELGVDIQGESSATESNGMKITKGNVAIKLKPIDGEQIDDVTKKADEVEVLRLNFERALGDGDTGTFVATMELSHDKDGVTNEATGSLTVSRAKEDDHHVHDVVMTMGTKGENPSYAREIIVRDVKNEPMKFHFLDIMNVGSDKETRHPSVIDLKAGTQCKGSDTSSGESPAEDTKTEPTKDKLATPVAVPSTTPGPVVATNPQPTKTPIKTPVQTPVQSPVQSKIKNGPTQMK
jgi:hypothetical protein